MVTALMSDNYTSAADYNNIVHITAVKQYVVIASFIAMNKHPVSTSPLATQATCKHQKHCWLTILHDTGNSCFLYCLKQPQLHTD